MRLAAILFLASTVGCGDSPADDDSPDASAATDASPADAAPADAQEAACADRTGGALVTFDAVGQEITLWITDDAFIDEAIAKGDADAGSPRVPVFDQVIAGTDCDPRWSFHVNPGAVSWADLTTEVCDATPSYIEGDVQSWIDSVGNWCPWGIQAITAVDDRR